MRLLEVRRQRLEFFVGDDVPPYAILSHTWGKDEVLFEHIRDAAPTFMEMEGWEKVQYTCTQARLDGYDYVWIDTCCIDKSSSAELSEAINSMFKWYLKAAICYAYLSDVNDTVSVASFEKSRWFTRGWTLQELIAPNNVIFYDSAWKRITSRQGLSAAQLSAIQRVTNLPESILRRDEELFASCETEMFKYPLGHDYQAQTCCQCSRREDSLPVLDSYIFAERMSWAAKRETTRVEDRAYSLLGLFGVTMPLLYGEGSRAFLRLQEAILKQSNDQSLLAYARSPGDNRGGLLADSPDLFAHSQVTNIVQPPGAEQPQTLPTLLIIGVTARTIELDMLLYPCNFSLTRTTRANFDVAHQITQVYNDSACWIALLPYVFKDDLLSRVGIVLTHAFWAQGDKNCDDLKRIDCQALVKVSPRGVDDSVMAWNSDRGWSINTASSCSYDADRCEIKTVRLHLAPSASTASSSAVTGNGRGAGPRIALSAATILRLPAETYRYIGGAPGAGRPISTKRIARGHTQNDQYYIPPTAIEGLGLVSEYFPQDILGIICISHVSIRTPFLVIWGEAYDSRHRDLAARENRVWCKVFSASHVEGWDQVVPSMLPSYLLGSDVALSRLVRSWKHNSRGAIKHSIWPWDSDIVDVKRVNWLGATLYEIVVTLAKDSPLFEEPDNC